jgi:hypothetical protein
MGLVGRREATRVPTSVKSRATARKMKGTFAVPQTPASSTTRVGLLRTRRTADAESSATDNRPSDQASREAARRFIPPTPRYYVPLSLPSQHHSTVLPSPKRYGICYEEKFRKYRAWLSIAPWLANRVRDY